MDPDSTHFWYFAYDVTSSPKGFQEATDSYRPVQPVAVAMLNNFCWYINDQGFPNIWPVPPVRSDRNFNNAVLPKRPTAQIVSNTRAELVRQAIPLLPHAPCSEVWGTLYHLPKSTLEVLNEAQGYNPGSAGAVVTGGSAMTSIRPREQGSNKRNRWKLKVSVMTALGPDLWLEDGERLRRGVPIEAYVYVDEKHKGPGRLAASLRFGLSDSLNFLRKLGPQGAGDWAILHWNLCGLSTGAGGVRVASPDIIRPYRQREETYRNQRTSGLLGLQSWDDGAGRRLQQWSRRGFQGTGVRNSNAWGQTRGYREQPQQLRPSSRFRVPRRGRRGYS